MSWRTVVISSSAKLDYQMGYLIVRNQDVVKIHISEISILMIETTSVSLTAALLCELTKKKIKVVFCDEKRNPSSELIPYYGSHDTSMKVRKQIAWSEDIKTSVWTEIVTEKIRKQAENLERWDRTEAQMLYEYITQIEFGDATNREGHAAKVYFNALFGLDFTRTAENSINVKHYSGCCFMHFCLRALLIQKDVKLRLFSLVLWYSLRALLICRVIKQSTLLCRYPDLRTLLLGDIK